MTDQTDPQQTTQHPETVPDLTAEQLLAEIAKADGALRRADADDRRAAEARSDAQQRGQRWAARLRVLLDEAGRREKARREAARHSEPRREVEAKLASRTADHTDRLDWSDPKLVNQNPTTDPDPEPDED